MTTKQEIVERLRAAGWSVVTLTPNDDNYCAVMLLRLGARPYPAKDVLLTLDTEEWFSHWWAARFPDEKPSIRVQAPSLLEALMIAANDAGVEIDDG